MKSPSTRGFASDDTDTAAQRFPALQAGGPSPAPNLRLVLGADFPGMTGNLFAIATC